MAFSWTNKTTKIADQVHGYQAENVTRENELYLRERLDLEHDLADGSHDWPAAGVMPAKAFCIINSTPTVEPNSFNVSSVSKTAVGIYRVVFGSAIGTSAFVTLAAFRKTAAALAGWTHGPIVRVRAQNSSYVDIALHDGIIAQDLAAGEYFSVAVYCNN